MIVRLSLRTRQVVAACVIAASLGPFSVVGAAAVAADMPEGYAAVEPAPPDTCAERLEHVRLWDRKDHPTVPARTPYYTCVTGETPLPGEMPPPLDYCCR